MNLCVPFSGTQRGTNTGFGCQKFMHGIRKRMFQFIEARSASVLIS